VVLHVVAHPAEVEREGAGLGQARPAALGVGPAAIKVLGHVGALGLVLRLVAVWEGGQPQHECVRVGVERAEAVQPLPEECLLRLGAHDAVGRVGVLVQRAIVPKDAEPRVDGFALCPNFDTAAGFNVTLQARNADGAAKQGLERLCG